MSAFGDNAAAREQARAIRDQARAGGLRFEAYLPDSLADWLLEQVEKVCLLTLPKPFS